MSDSSLLWLSLAGVAVLVSVGWCAERLDVLPVGKGAAAPAKMMDAYLKGRLADAFARRKTAYETYFRRVGRCDHAWGWL